MYETYGTLMALLTFEIDFQSPESLDNLIREIATSVMLSRRPGQYITEEIISKQRYLTNLGDIIVMLLMRAMFGLESRSIDGKAVQKEIVELIEELNKCIQDISACRKKCSERK